MVKGKGRPKGALGRKGVVAIALPAEVEFSSTAGTRGRGSGRGRGRGRGASHEAGHRISSTRRHPSAFEIDLHEFPPTSTAPARLQKRPIEVDSDSSDDTIIVDHILLPEAQQLLDESLAEIATGRPPITLSTTQVALARGAGGGSDVYVAGTVKERAYMRSKTTIAEKDIYGDKTLDKLADKWAGHRGR